MDNTAYTLKVERPLEAAGRWHSVAGAADLAPGQMLAVKLREALLVLYNVDGNYYCTDNVCTHAFAMLSDGWLEHDVIECPLHGGRFNVRDGKGLCDPIEHDLRTYPVRVAGELLEVLVED